MKRIAELSLLTSSLKIVHIVFLADLVLMSPVVNAGDARPGDAIIVNKSKVEKKEDGMKLKDLCQNKIDQVFLLSQAAEDIKENPTIKEQLSAFRDETDKLVGELIDLIHKQGGQPPKYDRSIITFFKQTWEKVRGAATGEKGELIALRNNIEKILKEEKEALESADLADPEKTKPSVDKTFRSTSKIKTYLDDAIAKL